MATVVTTEEFDGGRIAIKKVTVTGADDAVEQVIVEAAEVANPNNGRAYGYWTLQEAVWSINDGYDAIKFYYEDETNDLHVLTMHPGDGSWSARGYGGARVGAEVADEGTNPVDEDYEMKIDIEEDGAENAASSAHITFVFKKKDIPTTLHATLA